MGWSRAKPVRQEEGGGVGLVLTCLKPCVCVSKEDVTVYVLLEGLYQMRIWGILSQGG